MNEGEIIPVGNVEEQLKPQDLAKNGYKKGGRPRKYPKGYRGPRGSKVRMDQEHLDAIMFQRLLGAQDRAVGGLEDAFMNCQDPQKLTAAMLNLRELMEKVSGNKAKQKSKEIASALKVGNETLSREKAIEIASGSRSASDIANILKK